MIMPGRQVNADEMIDLLRECGGRKPGAAAEIDGAFEEGRLLRGDPRGHHRLEDQRRGAIVEIVDQRVLEARGVLVEQRLHIGLGHLRHLGVAEPHQMQASAVLVLGIGPPRFSKCGDRLVALAELLTDFAEREPGRGEVRRELDRLLYEVSGGGQIALELEVACELEAAVGDEIAGSLEQAERHWEPSRHCRA
ncbi:hypothetical protein ABH987_000871 [Bradyrhizobium ottawaense]